MKYILPTVGLMIITSCLVSKKKYEALESENTKLKKELTDYKNPTVDMGVEKSKISYSLGVNIASSLKTQGLEQVDTAAIAKAMGDVYSNRETQVSPQVAQQTLQEYFGKIQNEKIEKMSAEGAKFLALNSMKEGVVSLPSGLQYKIIKEGTGAKPNATDKVKTHYTGTLIDGTVFDSSIKRGQPAVFPVNGVIKGWVQALQLMPVGSKWELYIPHYLAYGERGNQSIPPYAALIFQIELIEIVK